MEKFPQIVTFRLNSECNNNCAYCYGPKNVKGLPFSELKKMFSLFAEKGVKGIVITGGEPLLRKDIVKIFQELKKYHIKIYLDTNGDYFFKYKKEINKYIDVLGLPLDFSSNKDFFRNKKHFSNILKILNYYQTRKKRPILRIGTVVTKKNIGDLEGIGQILLNYKPDIWKIYQLIPTNKGVDEKLSISQNRFEGVARKTIFRFSEKLNIIISARNDRASAYFMLNPDGTVIMPIEKRGEYKEETIGNIFNKDIIKRWIKYIHESRYMNNAEPTFSFKYSRFPMKEKYNQIWHLAKEYYKKGQFYNINHIEWMIKESLNVSKKEHLDDSIFVPFVILHDIGYLKVPKDSPFKKNTRKIHMREGGALSKEVLNKVKYPKNKTNLISSYISKHDNWALGDNYPYNYDISMGVFNDLDFISMLEPGGFKAMKKLLKKGSEEMIEHLKNDEKLKNRPFVAPSTKKIHKEYMDQLNTGP